MTFWLRDNSQFARLVALRYNMFIVSSHKPPSNEDTGR